MTIDVKSILDNTDIVEVIGRFVRLEKKGASYVGLCPFHDDNRPSMHVHPAKQIFKCFVCEEGGDVIQFLTSRGMSFREACNYLKDGTFIETQSKFHEQNKPTWKQIVPDRHPVSFQHYRLGEPNQRWEYHNEDGVVIGYICRFDTEDGKEIMPYTYCTDGTRREWRWQGFSSPRSLYRLNLIHQYPDAKIVVVEGEKTADAVQQHYNPKNLIATTWIGGTSAVAYTDFSPINGRDIVLWPDHDTEAKYASGEKKGEFKSWEHQPGNQAMLKVMSTVMANIKWLYVPDEYPHKWDAADKEWSKGEITEFIREHIGEPPSLETVEPITKPEPKFIGKSLITFNEGIDLWVKSIRPEDNKLSLGFPSFNKEMRGRLRGKMCVVLGYGGSKKSLYSQWVSWVNIMEGQRGIYSSMEMGLAELMARYIDMAVEQQGYSPTYQLEYNERMTHGVAGQVLRERVSQSFADRMFMTDSASMTTERYQEMIDEVALYHGRTDILVVDGLSMMGGEGTETEVYSRNSKELKELAKQNNMFVMLIAHLSKGANKDARDVARLVRSSEKIIDNCDFYITMSMQPSPQGEGMYYQDRGNARLSNKRGTGNVIDIEYKMEQYQARFVEDGAF